MRAALVSMVLCGCSWITVVKPPDKPGPPPVECTQSLNAPIVDTIVAAAFGIASGVFLHAYVNAHGGDPDDQLDDLLIKTVGVNGAIFGVTAIVSTASAISGYTHTARCRALNPRPEPPRATDLHARPRDDDD